MIKKQSSIQFILQRPLSDIKANLIQTMNMCKGMANNNQKVSLIVPICISAKEAESILNSIIKNYENYFNLVYSWGVIHHSHDTETILKNIFKSLKINGNHDFLTPI